MQALLLAVLCVTAQVTSVKADGMSADVIGKILELITELQGKIVADGEAEEKAYSDFYEWCDDASKEKSFEIKTATSKKEKLEATIEQAGSDIEDASTTIEELSSKIATSEADLKAATEIRTKEKSDFEAEEAELTESIDMLGRAIRVLEKEMGSSLAQVKVNTADTRGLLQTISTVITGLSFSSQDTQRLTALLQSQQDSEDGTDEDLGAPAPDAYKSKSGGIVDVLQDMKDKAETQLSESRKAEMKASHNYDLLKTSLVDGTSAAKSEMDDSKANKAEAEEAKAGAEGELEVTTKALNEATKVLRDMQMDCMEKASDHEISMKGRKEELAAIAKAKKIIQTTTFTQTASFLQMSSASKAQTRRDVTGSEVVKIVKQLARDQQSGSLAQLASRITAVIRFGGRGGADPFEKVKGMIGDMIAKLVKEAQEEAEEKAYCDSEMAKTEKKKNELTDDVDALTAKIDKASSASVRLKEEVKDLQSDLAELSDSQANMDKIRQETHAAFLETKADLEQGLNGIRQALKVLRDYYSKDESFIQENTDEASDAKFDAFMQQPAAPEKHEKSSGAGGSIIGMLEVAESDFAKNLAEEQDEEDAAQAEYEKITQDNKVTKATKEQDVKYKTKEYKALDKSITEFSADREGLQTELDAVLEYDTKIKEKCVAKPESYEERKKRRDAEIKGLKEALSILEGEAVFLQRRSPY